MKAVDMAHKMPAVDELNLSIRAFNCIQREVDVGGPCSMILKLNARHMKHFGKRTFQEVCRVLMRECHLTEAELIASPFWQSAPRNWRPPF